MQTRTMRSDRLLVLLRSSIILQNLSRRELRRFAAICELRDYAAGELLVQQDSIGSDLHLLLEGTVDITVHGKEHEAVHVSEVRKGDVLGEASIFSDLPRTASAVARVACLVAAVPRERLFAYCNRNPRAGLKLFAFVIFSLLKRLQTTSRELAQERESVLTKNDLDQLLANLPKSLEGMLGSSGGWAG
ncbi:MAG TPA: cyclic nucleotide-binding domain-containing protein [Rectinemataceae bacterium]|nr:cyclic nucleotide-binding domain-containing protein [Rectinemataceae bacterium]